MLQVQARRSQRQQVQRRSGTGVALVYRQRSKQRLGDIQQLLGRLWPDQSQAHAPGLVVALVIRTQRPLKLRRLHSQRAAITCQKRAAAMPGSERLSQSMIDATVGILAARLVFGMQHLALAHLRVDLQQRLAEYIQQTHQRRLQQPGRQLADEIGVPRLCRGIDQPAMTLDEGHQALVDRVIAAAEKQQMFEKVRQAWIGLRLVMTARRHP